MSEEPPRRRRHRRLSDEERTLWRDVTRGIAPLRTSAIVEVEEVVVELASDAPPRPPQPRTAPPAAKPTEPARPAMPPLAPLGRRTRQRIARGSHAIDGRLDLHGLTQHEAHDALIGFLRAAHGRGAVLVLVITGKGASGGEGGGRGVLKRQVPQWLRLPALRELVVGFEPAHATHGGEGALYVRIRRRREPS
jgi:DNA-nicking Smr family endonuclease